MTTKKAQAVIKTPVVKHCTLTVRGKPGARQQRDLIEDLSSKLAQGFKVYTMGKTHQGVVLQLGKTENWTIDELLTEIEALQEDA